MKWNCCKESEAVKFWRRECVRYHRLTITTSGGRNVRRRRCRFRHDVHVLRKSVDTPEQRDGLIYHPDCYFEPKQNQGL